MPSLTLPPPCRLAFLLLFAAGNVLAQSANPAYEPSVGQDGKDVVWVPTPQVVVDKMLDIAKVTSTDFVMDLGSGDGRTVITAAKRGAKAVGIEYNPDMVALSRRNAEKAGVGGKAEFRQADLFATDFSQASVVTMFLLPDINLKLRPKILEMKPGTRIVSNTFTMGDWQPDEKADLRDTCGASYCTVLFWVVPAKVAGEYRVPQGELVLKQEFQVLTGTLTTGGKALAVEGAVRGNDIAFTAGGKHYRGSVSGKQVTLH